MGSMPGQLRIPARLLEPLTQTCEKLAELRRRYPDRLRLRAPANAVKMTLRQQAAGAARLRNLDVLVAKIAANRSQLARLL